MYDIIGDIHGHAAELKLLLQKMDYKLLNGVWQHANRKVIFLGDYIDRGPEIRETLHIVRSMSESGNAIALLGNHEYNAMAYHFQISDGSFLRPHSDKNEKQHKNTVKEFDALPEEWQSYLQWFYTLPLYLDQPELRAVHACWDDEHIDWFKEYGYDTMTEELLIKSHVKNSKSYQVIDEVLKGKEVDIPEQFKWKDKGNHYRTSNRIKWWKDVGVVKKGEFLFDCPPELSEE
ncbi:MAG: metallophosphoesterase, partial [Chitinophagaceae bacterium]|nr:metallophosphoesterase [Chitinophagaceae bacterium]